ncbi:Zn(2)-C6 fungal-type domain-containing protein [Fusarium falciforme]|uniref:Zn(2)-C6 fungal-type domain-containing protein n=1 Tax=Fusarium falciforme TaxID=195108 RepID=UPI0023014472|nr:Zn(2)-C6 fungal-type domain-containing protein [Fusarium falciforme]WAO91253.1 Zn(2)-C6 fungal-type domain-containing protein [Fusarium falciforme]
MSTAMPTRRVKRSERRRCAKACDNCKRRKERCDGCHPCGRCRSRHVSDDCTFTSSPRLSSINPIISRPGTLPEGHDIPAQDNLSGLGWTASHEEPSAATHSSSSPLLHGFNGLDITHIPQVSRLIQDGHGKVMFIGDSANLAFLQIIRRLVRESLGPCQFAEDPLGHLLIETTPLNQSDWILEMVSRPPARPEPADAQYLITWYLRATNCLLNLYDERELYQVWSRWIQAIDDGREPKAVSAILFLIFAIGAQACPDDRDDDAERYFNYGRFLTISGIMEEPGLSTVRANILITMYLLAASRRNAAFMYLGTAVRAAYALGIHRRDINALFDLADYTARERLWKALRILDLFMSASLGRPPSTHETRDTSAKANYSACNDLCAIFEEILTDVYSKRMVSTDILERITEHHRQWTNKFLTGLAVDDIQPTQFIEVDGGKAIPNIGLFHLKEAYYWTIMLLARPFLIENVSKHLSKVAADDPLEAENGVADSSSDLVVTRACVDSAIRTVDLLRMLQTSEEVPKRLPVVVNSLFMAALVIGLAQLGDMSRLFPLEKSLSCARALLAVFGRHDAVASRNLAIVDNLQTACSLYLEKMESRRMERQSILVGGLFGVVHGDTTTDCPVAVEREEAHEEQQDCTRLPGLDHAPFINPVGLPSCSNGNSLSSSDSGTEPMIGLSTDLQGMDDLILPMYPRTLMFETFDKDIPLFPTVDARHPAWDLGQENEGELLI